MIELAQGTALIRHLHGYNVFGAFGQIFISESNLQALLENGVARPEKLEPLVDALYAIGAAGPAMVNTGSAIAELARTTHQLAGADITATLTTEEKRCVFSCAQILALIATQAKARRIASATRAVAAINPTRAFLGPGPKAPVGWVTVGAPPADISFDLMDGLPFKSGTLEFIYLSHVLEHLYYPSGALGLLTECYRVLKVGGVMRVVVPNIGAYLEAYVAKDETFFRDRRSYWTDLPETVDPLYECLNYAGAYDDPASFFDAHKFGYDATLLHAALLQAGFTKVERSSYQGSASVALQIDHLSEVANAKTSVGDSFSLFYEAFK